MCVGLREKKASGWGMLNLMRLYLGMEVAVVSGGRESLGKCGVCNVRAGG